jgi:phosphopantothenoylcysteine decarboxylase/phosphopantothenate--cysteine ligase
VHPKRVLLVIGGGIAAYKCLELIRRLKERGVLVRCVLTRAAKELVSPLAVAALSGEQVFDELFSLTDEAQMGHIGLSREADLVVVAPATADLLARMAAGLADDLATTLLLATDKPVLVAPAMNPQMWAHPATRRNLARLEADGIEIVGPAAGDMACGETGPGRLVEPAELLEAILARLEPAARGLLGVRALVTSGPTHEPIDPVRYLANRSSGRQGHAIAAALARAGATVTLVSGPVAIADPPGVRTVRVETARQMHEACLAALPVEVAVCAAAVADWRPEAATAAKLKKEEGRGPPALHLVENPDILAALARHPTQRPRLVVGFAAETGGLEAEARAKRAKKGCDWILANDVSEGTGVLGGSHNQILFLTGDGPAEPWEPMSKEEVALRLVDRIAAAIGRESP